MFWRIAFVIFSTFYRHRTFKSIAVVIPALGSESAIKSDVAQRNYEREPKLHSTLHHVNFYWAAKLPISFAELLNWKSSVEFNYQWYDILGLIIKPLQKLNGLRRSVYGSTEYTQPQTWIGECKTRNIMLTLHLDANFSTFKLQIQVIINVLFCTYFCATKLVHLEAASQSSFRCFYEWTTSVLLALKW